MTDDDTAVATTEALLLFEDATRGSRRFVAAAADNDDADAAEDPHDNFPVDDNFASMSMVRESARSRWCCDFADAVTCCSC